MKMQYSFDRIRGNYADDKAAKQARDKCYRQLCAIGVSCKRFVLKNQLVQYSSFGNPCGEIRDCYYLQLYSFAGVDTLEQAIVILQSYGFSQF